jgi:YD repeat-containing protein
VSPDTGTATHTYDAADNLKTRTDSRGVLATYSYDALNRATGVVYSKSGQPNLSHSRIARASAASAAFTECFVGHILPGVSARRRCRPAPVA